MLRVLFVFSLCMAVAVDVLGFSSTGWLVAAIACAWLGDGDCY